jgi:hypothetical protein
MPSAKVSARGSRISALMANACRSSHAAISTNVMPAAQSYGGPGRESMALSHAREVELIQHISENISLDFSSIGVRPSERARRHAAASLQTEAVQERPTCRYHEVQFSPQQAPTPHRHKLRDRPIMMPGLSTSMSWRGRFDLDRGACLQDELSQSSSRPHSTPAALPAVKVLIEVIATFVGRRNQPVDGDLVRLIACDHSRRQPSRRT